MKSGALERERDSHCGAPSVTGGMLRSIRRPPGVQPVGRTARSTEEGGISLLQKGYGQSCP